MRMSAHPAKVRKALLRNPPNCALGAPRRLSGFRRSIYFRSTSRCSSRTVARRLAKNIRVAVSPSRRPGRRYFLELAHIDEEAPLLNRRAPSIFTNVLLLGLLLQGRRYLLHTWLYILAPYNYLCEPSGFSRPPIYADQAYISMGLWGLYSKTPCFHREASIFRRLKHVFLGNWNWIRYLF